MTYIPKSKLNIKTTNGKEFRSVQTKKAYVGKYMQLSNGKLLIGSDPLNPGGELELLSPPSNNLGFSADVRLHQILRPEISLKLSKVKDIPFTKNTPTEDDYVKGYFIRYFVKKANQNTFYKEVSKKIRDINKLKEIFPHQYKKINQMFKDGETPEVIESVVKNKSAEIPLVENDNKVKDDSSDNSFDKIYNLPDIIKKYKLTTKQEIVLKYYIDQTKKGKTNIKERNAYLKRYFLKIILRNMRCIYEKYKYLRFHKNPKILVFRR